MVATNHPTINFKRGDDFKLDLTVTDTNNTTALENKVILDAAQVTYDEAVAADPQVPQDIIDAQAALDVAQADYDASIIVDISTWTITSMVGWRGKFINEFVVILTDPTIGLFTITLGSADTVLWEPREYQMDIQFVRTEGKVSSETMIIDVEKDITSG